MTMYILAQGTLHRDPQARTSASGRTFTTANVRIEQDGTTTWCSVICFDSTACEEMLRLRAGDSLSVQGKLKVSVFEKAGEHRPALDIVATAVVALKPKPRTRQPRQGKVDSRQFDPRDLHGAGGQHQVEDDFNDPVLF